MQEVYGRGTLRVTACRGRKEAELGMGAPSSHEAASARALVNPGSSEAGLVLHSHPELQQGAELSRLHVIRSLDMGCPHKGRCDFGQRPLSSAEGVCQQPAHRWGKEPFPPDGADFSPSLLLLTCF